MLRYVSWSFLLIIVGNEFQAGDPFLCAVLHPLDFSQVVAAQEIAVPATKVNS